MFYVDLNPKHLPPCVTQSLLLHGYFFININLFKLEQRLAALISCPIYISICFKLNVEKLRTLKIKNCVTLQTLCRGPDCLYCFSHLNKIFQVIVCGVFFVVFSYWAGHTHRTVSIFPISPHTQIKNLNVQSLLTLTSGIWSEHRCCSRRHVTVLFLCCVWIFEEEEESRPVKPSRLQFQGGLRCGAGDKGLPVSIATAGDQRDTVDRSTEAASWDGVCTTRWTQQLSLQMCVVSCVQSHVCCLLCSVSCVLLLLLFAGVRSRFGPSTRWRNSTLYPVNCFWGSRSIWAGRERLKFLDLTCLLTDYLFVYH